MTLLLAVLVAALPAQAATAAGLAREEAAARAERVSDVRYTLAFAVDADSPTIPGRAIVHFKLRGPAAPLALDYGGGLVEALSVNGVDVSSPAYDGRRLQLPAEALREGANIASVLFRSRYGSEGLYRARDPVDGRVYVYTDFEPYDANRLFPCFDQPDLKATYSLEVDAPLDWTVISAARESEVLPGAPGRRLWSFPETKPFSTYLVSLHAGPFVEWSSSADGIPLRLFARRSLAEHVPAREWFDVTKAGLRFYGEYFGLRYPFEKYDQVLLPDFHAGAMENVAAVTFSEERFVRRSAATRQQRLERASTILHEMAHMWFGDLVTMRWWDDLWLNESFATYMAALALSEATEFREAWLDFQGEKRWGYAEDQQPTTHPVETPVPDTEQAFANFDGITYGKGAAALKQAAHALGARAFRDGVRAYLSENAYLNAERRHFVAALEKASGRRLGDWTREWLQAAGLNTAEARWSCAGGKIDSFELVQSTASGAAVLRSHRTRIAFFEERDGRLVPAGPPLDAGYRGGRSPVPAALGRPCPALVLPNEGDHDYVKLVLDPESLAAARRGLSTVEGELDRAMLWGALWDMARDARLPVQDYAELVARHLPAESSLAIAQRVVLSVSETRPLWGGSVLGYLSGDGPALRALAGAEGARFEGLFWELLARSEPGGDPQKLWFESYVDVASTPAALERLRSWLGGEGLPPGFSLDQDRRWRLLWQLSRRDDPAASSLLEAERRRDGTRRGQSQAAAVAAARPRPEVKREWFERLVRDDADERFDEQRAVMEAIFPPEQEPLQRALAQAFYARLPALGERRSGMFLGYFTPSFAPLSCDAEGARSLEEFLAAAPKLPAIALKGLRQALDEDRRCARVRELAARSGR